jgi:hypothetical protein
MFNITLSYAPAYHPEGNSICESFNKTLLLKLRSLCGLNQKSWRSNLPIAMYSYRHTPHSAIRLSPLETFFGRSPNLAETANRWAQTSKPTDDLPLVFHRIREEAEKLQATARHNIEVYNNINAKCYDVSAKPHKFVVMDKVLIRRKHVPTGDKMKLASAFMPNTCYIQSFIGRNTVQLANTSNHAKLSTYTYVDRLRLYNTTLDENSEFLQSYQEIPQELLENAPHLEDKLLKDNTKILKSHFYDNLNTWFYKVCTLRQNGKWQIGWIHSSQLSYNLQLQHHTIEDNTEVENIYEDLPPDQI